MKLISSYHLKYIHRGKLATRMGILVKRGNCHTNLGGSLKVRHSRFSRREGERLRETAPGMGVEGFQEAKMLRWKRWAGGILQLPWDIRKDFTALSWVPCRDF